MCALNLREWPIVSDENIEAVLTVARSGNWHYGRVADALEADISKRLGRYVVATSSCAWAIYLCLKTLENRKSVAVPAYTYWGTIHPVIWAGAKPVFVDVNPRTFNMCAQDLKKKLREGSIDCVLAVHLFGQPISSDVVDLCDEFEVPLVEDACQAFGASLDGTAVGTIGASAALSFNNRKTLPAGIGGAAVFSCEEQAKLAKEKINYGCKDIIGNPLEPGLYLPISEFDAALARSQLVNLRAWISHSQNMADLLSSFIPSHAPFVNHGTEHSWHKFRVYGSKEQERRLQDAGIPTSRWMNSPMIEVPAYRKYVTADSNFPGAEEVASASFCILDDRFPIVAQTEETVNSIGKTCMEIFND